MIANINKAWWINLVKQHGANGGMSYLQQQAHKTYAETKEAVDFILGLGYVQMNREGTSVRYTVTSFGHRYLNENAEELGEIAAPSPAPDTSGAVRGGRTPYQHTMHPHLARP